MTNSEKWEPGDPRDRSITGFRIRNGGPHGPMTKKFFYKMDDPPKVKTVGGRRIITPQAELEWQSAPDKPGQVKSREAHRERMRRAAALAIASPRHPCNAKRKRETA